MMEEERWRKDEGGGQKLERADSLGARRRELLLQQLSRSMVLVYGRAI